jgi:phospholipid/cholesterol/gamma-HCH transport system substrate-binding protein
MKTTRNAIAVGILTVGILVGLYLAVEFVSDSVGAAGHYRVWAIFPDASGLHEKSHVRIAGLKVGQIDKITLETYTKKAPDEKTGKMVDKTAIGARVVFLISGDVKLYENAKALKAADSLLGDQLVILHPGDVTAEPLGDGDQIKETGESGLMGNIDKITQDIQTVTSNLKNVFGSEEGGQQMTEVLKNLRDISQSINDLVKSNQDSVKSTLDNIEGIAADTRPGIKQIVRDIQSITEEIRVFVQQNTASAGDAVKEADGTIKDIRKTVATLDKTVNNLNEVIEGVNKGEGTVGRLLKDDKLIDDVEGTVEEVGDFVQGMTRLKTILGLGAEYNVLTNSFRTGVSLRLQPREDKYYLIEVANDPRGTTSRTETVTESTNPEDPAQYREVKTVTKDSFVFSVMFARRVYFATFRFGIKDNTGGLGVDLHFFDDRFEISSDIYRFNANVFPLLKETVAIEFLKSLYLIGGITDALNPQRDFFLGLMLRFDDQDLKTVLPFVPSTG